MSNVKISLLHPSWGRPVLARSCYDVWMGNCDKPEQVEYVLCLCEQDKLLEEYRRAFAGTVVQMELVPNNGLVIQTNHAASVSRGNLLIGLSDDFVCPAKWDGLLLRDLEGKVDHCVKTQDGLQPFIHTLPMMDRTFYERFGYMFHPEYNHMYGDNELAEVGKLLGRTITLPHYFAHEHYSQGKNPKDAVNVLNDSFMMVDRETFVRRKRMQFGIKLLSILVPTLPARDELLTALLREFVRQVAACYQIGNLVLENCPVQINDGIVTVDVAGSTVEILVDRREEWTTGEKRNKLMARAKGEYVVYFDVDDRPAEHYIYSVMKGIAKNPDNLSLIGVMTTNGNNPVRFVHSIKYNRYYDEEGVLYRPPNHLNVMRRSLIMGFMFPEKNWGEDTEWAMEVCRAGVLQREVWVDEPLYHYRFTYPK